MKVCLYASYDNSNNIKEYVKYYLLELLKYYHVIFITNARDIIADDINFLYRNNIEFKFVKNEGMDFGMWYKGMIGYNLDSYDEIALVNDSCILFGNLDYFIKMFDDLEDGFYGMTDSNQISYHIQSYFLHFKGRNIINDLLDYFKTHGIISSSDNRDIINIYEIGLSDFLINKGHKCKSIFDNNNFEGENISVINFLELYEKGYPMIKKKLIKMSFLDHELKWLHNNGFNNLNYKQYLLNKNVAKKLFDDL